MKNKASYFAWVITDILLVVLSFLSTVYLFTNFNLNAAEVLVSSCNILNVVIASLLFVLTAVFAKVYGTIWKYAGTKEFLRLVSVCFFDTAIFYAILKLSHSKGNLAVCLMFFLMLAVSTCGVRIIVRLYANINDSHKSVYSGNPDNKNEKILVVGAGRAASILIEDIQKSEDFSNSSVVGVVDDDENLWGKYIRGVKIMGGRNDIVEVAKQLDASTIIYAIPSLDENERTKILKICSQTECELKSMPSVSTAISDDREMLKLKKVEIEDLLERVPIKIDVDKIIKYVEGKTVLVTGGGGSIGSELCRQIAAHKPGKLIIFDVYENNAYDIQNELKSKYPNLELITLIGSVRDSRRLDAIFSKYHPNIVYHAAAHKHVPLMEDSPNEAIKNNVFGTLKTALSADKYGVERFVLISTDKAVNPTNVMGASKRICEMIVQSMSRRSKTEFVAVRFGNVLGSNGSVIPLFRKQIQAGGPVLVTHPDIIRYFMTIPEAVSLVLTAGAMAKGGEIFVLDMGKPVKIVDLAKNMIRLMGYRVDKDIKIEYIGLRPGEKLFEELLMDEEGLRETDNHLIHIGNPLVFDDDWFYEKLHELETVMYDDNCDIRSLIHEIVPTFRQPCLENKGAADGNTVPSAK